MSACVISVKEEIQTKKNNKKYCQQPWCAYNDFRQYPLQWRHNGCNGVSNHQPHDCLLNRLFRHRLQKASKLRVTGLCEWNPPMTGEFPAQRAITRKMFPYDDVIMPEYIFWLSKSTCSILRITFPFDKYGRIYAFVALNVSCSVGPSKQSRHCGYVVILDLFLHVVHVKIKTVSVDNKWLINVKRG